MKKILKTLFDWSGRALQSQHLRTIVLLAFLVVGADVAWGLGIKRNISMTNVSVASNGEFTNNVYSWKANYDNLIEFKDLTSDGTTDLSEYDKIVIMMGTNCNTVGAVTDTSADVSTMCGAVRYCLEKLCYYGRKISLGIILPIRRSDETTNVLPERFQYIKQIAEEFFQKFLIFLVNYFL